MGTVTSRGRNMSERKMLQRAATGIVIAAVFFTVGWLSHRTDTTQTNVGNSTSASVAAHEYGATVKVPTGLDTNWLTPGYMTTSGVSTVTVLKVVVATKPTSLIETKGPLSYEVDVLVRACANALGFDAVDGSHSADLADAVASHLFLVPSVQRGINGTYFGTPELSNIGTPPQLIHDRLMTLSPTMKPHQCFTGVVPFAVPLALGSRSDQTQYSLALASYPFFTYGNVQSVWWAPRAS